jgi:hypothetical protein
MIFKASRMAKTVSLIGVEHQELRWLRLLLSLLRHPDRSVPELARQALLYLDDAARRDPSAASDSLGHKE